MSRSLIAVAMATVLAGASPALANNNYFIAGDAFFYFEIDRAEWEELKSGQLTKLEYDRPPHLSSAFCGYAGHSHLDIGSQSPELRDRLLAAITTMKQTYPSNVVQIDNPYGTDPEKVDTEGNKIRVFVYNKDFDFSKYRIGLKYNETWPEMAAELGHTKKHFKVDFFVDTPRGITESWRMSKDVPPLDADLPPIVRHVTSTPIPFDPARHQFLVAPPVSLETLAFPADDSGLRCLAVSSEGSRVLTVDPSHKALWKVSE
ncbi:MAG: hypothetical protein MK108_16060 [Mariniblastus sp.]|nr:hypothetical protein [Mariniblastus sp.]